MAFIVWRTARNMLDHMRKAGFDIDVGPPYFAFLREVLAFLVQVVDRIAYRTLGAEARAAFTGALGVRLAEILDESEGDLLGRPPEGSPSLAERFIADLNELAGHYAEFGDDGGNPDFGFVRYFGTRIEPIVPDKDRRWVLDQVMATEAPNAVDIVMRAMKSLHSAEPRPARRATMSGE